MKKHSSSHSSNDGQPYDDRAQRQQNLSRIFVKIFLSIAAFPMAGLFSILISGVIDKDIPLQYTLGVAITILIGIWASEIFGGK